jgi:hypothetical protein
MAIIVNIDLREMKGVMKPADGNPALTCNQKLWLAPACSHGQDMGRPGCRRIVGVNVADEQLWRGIQQP